MLKTVQIVFNFYPRRIIRNIKSIPWYNRTRKEFTKQLRSNNTDFPISKRFPCLRDRYDDSGSASGHYFHQDLLVAQELYKKQPKKHVDIGSRIDGFISHVASFREIEVMDIRPLNDTLPNIKFVQADCMGQNMDKYADYCDSVSSLHAIEHFGLGRYGDPIDVNGHMKGLDNIYNMLQTNGTFYFSVPQRIEFNAHRVFSVSYLLDYFKGKYDVESFSFVDDKGDIHRHAALNEESVSNNFNCRYGCGIFILKKI